VVITVVEQGSQYLEPRLGFSSGEGIRFAFEYGHRNIGGRAVALTLRVQLSYIPDFLIADPDVRENFAPLPIQDRLQRRNTLSINFPEIGLGPLVSLSLQGIDVRDNQRDFGLTKDAFIPTFAYRPLRQISTQLSASVERNNVTIFNETARNQTNANLRIPEGATLAFSERAAFTWDGRDNALNPTKGALISSTIEHVDAFPLKETDNPAKDVSHFLRLSAKVSGYIKLPWKLTLALSLAAGYNLQLTKDTATTKGSKTYPDRFFFLGGGDSIRSFLADAVVPQDLIDKIQRGDKKDNGKRYTIEDVTIRGGDLSLNPRVELRIPITDLFQAGVFLDAGNLWTKPDQIHEFKLQYGVGAGVRFTTPIGPLAFDYGINPTPYHWDSFGAFHFSIGLF